MPVNEEDICTVLAAALDRAALATYHTHGYASETFERLREEAHKARRGTHGHEPSYIAQVACLALFEYGRRDAHASPPRKPSLDTPAAQVCGYMHTQNVLVQQTNIADYDPGPLIRVDALREAGAWPVGKEVH